MQLAATQLTDYNSLAIIAGWKIWLIGYMAGLSASYIKIFINNYYSIILIIKKLFEIIKIIND